MIINRYVRGIAFVVLMLGVVSMVMAAAPTITFNEPPTPATGSTVAVDYVNVSVTLNETGTALLKWEAEANVSMTGSGTNFYYNRTGLSDGTFTYVVYANDTTIENWTASSTRTVTVSLSQSSGAPNLTYTPLSNPSSAFGATQSFTAASNQTVNFSWLINGTEVQYNASDTSATYFNNTAGIGVHSVTVNINNSNGTASRSWSWTVTDGTPPASITNLQLENNGTSWIKWNWTNPADTDFARVMVYIDSVFKENVTAPTSTYNATPLSSGSHTISTHTVDTSGNINSTWINLTNSTTPNTAVGTNRIVAVSNITLNFSNVDIAGDTIIADNNPASTSGFVVVGNFYNITTTANYTGAITVVIPYNAGVDGNYVRLFHYEGGAWKDVTTGRDTGVRTVTGQVTSLSPFVPGMFPSPVISTKSPDATTVQTIGNTPQNFTITFNQTVNVSWLINGSSTGVSNTSVTSSYYYNITPATGTWNITVVGNNTNGTASYKWLWTVRPKTYETGNRIWDANKEMSTTYTWNPMSFYAFYYDVDNNVGNESLKIILGSNSDRNIEENTLQYTTVPENVSFKYKGWGFYNVVGFMAEKYFAAYTAVTSKDITSSPVSPIGNKQLHKILMDDDTRRAVYAGSTLTLSEGYVLKVKDVDITGGKIVLFSLLKDGNEVDTTAIQQGNTYVYAKRVGSVSDLPIIAVRVENVFAGREANAAFLKGIFQLSESFTSINQGNRYGIMEITGASDTAITMVNKNSISLSPNSVNDVMGEIKIIVADNSSVLRFAPTVKKSGTYEVRGTISQSTDTTFDWNPLNFEGFYYDINEDVGSEKLSLTRSDRSIGENKLIYTTTPQSVSFKYKTFGSYNVIGFMADKYFAGYTINSTGITSNTISTIGSRQLHKILADDDTRRAVYAGSTLTLNEGYVLKVKDVDITGGKIVLLSLLKDGNEVDTTAIEAGKTYIYSKRVGSVSDLPIIAVHVDTVFAGREANAAFLKGVFQLSENYVSANTGDQFGAMKVSEFSDTKIEMKNPSSISLSSASTVDVMGNIKFKVADSGDVRFYPFIMVNGSIAAANQLSIDVPANPSVRDTITITVTAGSGTPIEGAAVGFDSTDIGTTNSTGKLSYTLTKSGMHNITATKLGYEKATKTIQVSEWVDNRLSIELPAVIDQGIPVSIRVISNGTAIAGASVTFDNSAIGTTDAKGILNYTFEVGGTHNLGASKDKYISVVREINVRLPFSEYKALDINIIPNVVFTNKEVVIRSNITNAGTKADTKPVELIFNGTVAENRTVALAPGEVTEVNFTRKEALPGNYTVEILGQNGLLEVREEPLNLLLIGGIATVFGAIIIYLLTAKSKLSLEVIRQKLVGKFGKGSTEITPPKTEEVKKQ